MTENKEQAERMAQRVVRFKGGSPFLNAYLFDEANMNAGILKTKIFDTPSEEWAAFVMDNRNKEKQHPIHQYDIIVGPIANDRMVTQFRLFEEGYIDMKELSKRIEYKDFTRQWFFATDESIKLLQSYEYC